MSSGRHQVTYDEGDQYDGDWNTDGQRHGWGSLAFADGTKYVGKFEVGLFAGGLLSFPDGSRYEGDFVAGKYHGFGIYTRSDGMKFEGQFADGKVNGFGLMTFVDGSHGRPRNEGQFEGSTIVNRCPAKDAVRRAQQAAHLIRTQISAQSQ